MVVVVGGGVVIVVAAAAVVVVVAVVVVQIMACLEFFARFAPFAHLACFAKFWHTMAIFSKKMARAMGRESLRSVSRLRKNARCAQRARFGRTPASRAVIMNNSNTAV